LAVLIHRQEHSVVVVSVLGNRPVDHVGSKALDSVRELVLHEVATGSCHQEMRPVGELYAVEVPVVLDDIKTILESGSVQKRVQSITASVQKMNFGGFHSN
jgi:hypothetical protein